MGHPTRKLVPRNMATKVKKEAMVEIRLSATWRCGLSVPFGIRP